MPAGCREALLLAILLSLSSSIWGQTKSSQIHSRDHGPNDAFAIDNVQRAKIAFADGVEQSILVVAKFRWNDSEQRLVGLVREQECGYDLKSRFAAIALEGRAQTLHLDSYGDEWKWAGKRPVDQLFTAVCRATSRFECSEQGCGLSSIRRPRQTDF